MKRFLPLLLILSLLLGACGKQPVLSLTGDTWYMGFAAEEIALPDEPLNIAGYHQAKKITGVRDLQRASAVWMDTGAAGILLISVDCIGLSRGTVSEIRARLGIDAPVLVTATHTHAGIDTLGLWGGLGIDGKSDAFQENLIEAAVTAGRQARENRTSGKLFFSQVQTSGMLRDSRDPQVFDETMHILRFEPETGNGLRIISFAAHAEALRGDNTRVSRDYPGVMADIIKEATGDDMLFLPGAIGGLIMTAELCEGTFDAEENLLLTGSRLAEYALSDAPERELSPQLLCASEEFDVPLDNTVFMLYRFLGILDNPVKRGRSDTGYALTTELSLLQLGDVTMALIPGEIFPELVYGGAYPADAADTLPTLAGIAAAHGISELLIAGLACDEIGYIVPPGDYLLHADAPYLLTPERDARGENHYEETNSAGFDTAACIVRAFESLLLTAFGELPR